MEKEENKVVETPVVEAKETEEKLSRRDALEVAIIAHKEPEKDEGARPVQEGVGSDESRKPEDTGDTVKQLEPPAEYSNEEKDDFKKLSRVGQEAQLRLDKSRRKLFEEARAEKEQAKRAVQEHNDVKALAESISPYLKAIGVKEPSEVVLKKALTMWREFEEGDPREAAAAYLEAKGIPVPDGFLETREEGLKDNLLRKELDEIKTKIAEKEMQEVGAVMLHHWQIFEGTKNAAGSPKFPDITETESGLKLASNIGSLVGGKSELSKQFIASVKSRIPDAGPVRLYEEAYRYLGGKVDESSTPSRTQDAQKHVKQSSRAASSVPGGGKAQTTQSGPVKKLSRREALAYAMAQAREAEGY